MEFLLPIITGLILLYSDLQYKKRINKHFQGHFTLRLNQAYKWTGLFCCLISSILINVAIVHLNGDLVLLPILSISFFLGLGVYILVWYYNYEVIFDDKRIIWQNWNQKKETINWNEVNKVKFNSYTGYLKLYTKSTRVIVLQHSIGFNEFLKMMDSKSIFITN